MAIRRNISRSYYGFIFTVLYTSLILYLFPLIVLVFPLYCLDAHRLSVIIIVMCEYVRPATSTGMLSNNHIKHGEFIACRILADDDNSTASKHTPSSLLFVCVYWLSPRYSFFLAFFFFMFFACSPE